MIDERDFRAYAIAAMLGSLAVLVGCGSSEASTTTSAAIEPPTTQQEIEPVSPFGRWFESSEGISHRFEEGAIIIVAEGQLQRRLRVPGWAPDAAGWYVQSSTSEAALFRIRPLPAGEYEFCERERCQALRSATDSSRLDAIVAAPPDESRGSCARAEACCRAAMPLLGTQCDVDEELGDRAPATCEAYLRGVRVLLASRPEIAAPGSCAP